MTARRSPAVLGESAVRNSVEGRLRQTEEHADDVTVQLVRLHVHEAEPGVAADANDGEDDDQLASQTSIRLSSYVFGLIGLDLTAAFVSALAAIGLKFGTSRPGSIQGISYSVMIWALPMAWLAAMWLGGAYDDRVLVAGPEEFRRVMNGSVWLLAAVAIATFVFRVPFSRVLIGVGLTGVTTLALAARYAARRRLQRRLRRQSITLHRAVVVGSREESEGLRRHMARNAHVGFSVTAVHVPRRGQPLEDRISELMNVVAANAADTIAAAATSGFNSSELRRLAWRLEGTGIRLLVVPAVTDFAGPRISIRPVDGLPLLHVEEPGFHGPKLVLKRCVDLVGAALITLLLIPVFVLIALCVLIGSGRPILYRQVRVGRLGKEFSIWKFRTMVKDAEQVHEQLLADSGSGAVLFKLESDPRITRVGAFLRRYSLDELPQLLNVLGGSMSLVGPRPQRPIEVAEYRADAKRRLLIKPGVTGLWQVSGRSTLPVEESLRLDLRYVENWSMGLDVVLLLKTFRAVIYGRGAY